MNFGDFMKKDEYIKKLEESLSKLEDADRKKVIKKYKSAFTRKTNAGQSEDEIIDSFGNFNELVKSILLEYGIDTPAQESASTIALFFKEFLQVVEEIVDYFTKKDRKEKILLILKILVVLLAISILKLPILFVRDLFAGLISLLFFPLNIIIGFSWRFICEVVYIIIAITVFVKVLNIILHPRKYRRQKK